MRIFPYDRDNRHTGIQKHNSQKRRSIGQLGFSFAPQFATPIVWLIFAVIFSAIEISSPSVARSEIKDNENPLSAEVKVVPYQVGVGGTGEFVVDLTLAEGYHAYLERFKFALDEPEGLNIASPKIEPVIQFMDAVSKKLKEGIQNKAQMHVLFEVPNGFATKSYTAHIRITYQACTEEHCLFPKTINLTTPFAITASMGAANAPIIQNNTVGKQQLRGMNPQSTELIQKSDLELALAKGTLPALLLVFIVGFLTSLTPCIYPMIPITLAVLGAHTSHNEQGKIRGLALSIVYVLGIATTYSSLGVAAASTGALFGSALSNIWVVTGLALIFVAMGLSMYGLFEIQAPAFIRNNLGVGKTSPSHIDSSGKTLGAHTKGYLGAYITGLVAGVVASPCVGPVLVSVLAFIAKTQDKLLGFMLLFTFALGMGMLLIALGLSSHLLRRLPRAGSWMESVKFIFGTTMVAMALYYIAPLYPAWLFRFLLGLSVLLIASFYGAFLPNAHLKGWMFARKGLMLGAFIVGAAFAASGLLEKSGYKLANLSTSSSSGNSQGTSDSMTSGSSPISTITTTEKGKSTNIIDNNAEGSFSKLAWITYTDSKLNEALKSGQPVILDFSAEWCVACKELERFTFTDPRIRGLSDQFVLLQVDATEGSAALDKLKAKYSVFGLPTMIFFDKMGTQKKSATVLGFEDADTFLKKMKSVL
jgi:thiol:disulfide interchange protein DsbD